MTALTCSASTLKSGSATVISTPIAKPTPSKSGSFFDFVKPAPTCSPIGVIARSAPTLKSAMPKMSIIADTTKVTISLVVKSVMGVTAKISTITATGSTEKSDSFSFERVFMPMLFAIDFWAIKSFSFSILLINDILFLLRILLCHKTRRLSILPKGNFHTQNHTDRLLKLY